MKATRPKPKTSQEIMDWLIFNGVQDRLMIYATYTFTDARITCAGLIRVHRRDLIKNCVIWGQTQEGFMFWEDVNNRYQEWYDGKTTMSGRTAYRI